MKQSVAVAFTAFVLCSGLAVLGVAGGASGSPPCGVCDSVLRPLYWQHAGHCNSLGYCDPCGGMEGTWYWMRTPEQERRVVMNLYNRYCVRCHGIDGRGVWDIPDVPNFANAAWQASRSDDQLARLTLEGRGAVMPAFRGTLTLEEAWGMARYLRTFIPGSEVSPAQAASVDPLLLPSPGMPNTNDHGAASAASPWQFGPASFRAESLSAW